MACSNAFSPTWPRSALVVAAVAACAACDNVGATPSFGIYDLARAGRELFAIPFPNDVRQRTDGSLDVAELAQIDRSLLRRYVTLIGRHRYGFATNGAAFFRFTRSLATDTLPATPAASVRPGASVFWVNIDKPGSAAYGERVPFTFGFEAKKTRYIGTNALTLLPVAGFALAPDTRYAVVVTEGLLDENGRRVERPPVMDRLLGPTAPTDPAEARAWSLYRPLRTYLERTGMTGVALATVFKSGVPTRAPGLARRIVHSLAAPTATEVVAIKRIGNFWEVRGNYLAPNFQTGKVPFSSPSDGGEIVFDKTGHPKIARMEKMRFALSVPTGTMPAAGWPVVLYAHGTGGDYRQFISNGTASTLARIVDDNKAVMGGLAIIGIDQVLHGPRAPEGTSASLNFFNVLNPVAGVDNVLQGAIDNFQLLRLVKTLRFRRLNLSKGTGGVTFATTVKFDPKKIYFMGHSQGALTGPGFLAAEPEVKGAVLSGGGAVTALTLLHKKTPVNFKSLVEIGTNEAVHAYHPMVSLVQQIFEAGDPANYAALITGTVAGGTGAKHLLVSQGLIDHYVPGVATHALAAAARIPLIGEEVEAVPALTLRKLTTSPGPVAGNVTTHDGRRVTAGLVQYRGKASGKSCKVNNDCGGKDYCDAGKCRRDGHYVMFDDSGARRQLSRFFMTMVRDGVPTIVR